MTFRNYMETQYQWNEQFYMEPIYSQLDMEQAWNVAQEEVIRQVRNSIRSMALQNGWDQDGEAAIVDDILRRWGAVIA